MGIIRRSAGLMVAALIGLIAAVPLLRGIPEGADTLLHLYRLVQLDTLIQNGILYSRWAPDLAFGFGYPLFNYYAPAAYYLGEFFHIMGLSLVGAFLAIYILAFIGIAIFTLMWVRDIFDEPAGLVAAVMVSFAPYVLVNGLHRGALAEHVALALLPLILWAFRRTIIMKGWFYSLTATLSLTALLLSHNINALVFTPVLVVYVLMVGYTRPATGTSRLLDGLRHSVPAFLPIILSLGISAFFWLPALAERNLVQIVQTYGPSHFNYQNNFLAITELLALPFTADPNLVNQPRPFSFGLVAILMGFIGLISARLYRRDLDQFGHILFAGLVLIGSLFMATSISERIWELVPLLPFVQFPWRFLGLGTLFLAMLAGVGTTTVLDLVQERKWVAASIPAIIIGVAAIYMIPWQVVDYYDPTPLTTTIGSFQFEQQSGAVGTTSAGEYLPVSVQELPSLDNIEAAPGKQRLNYDALMEEVEVLSASYQPLEYELTVDSPNAFSAVFDTFFFEGWEATIDGEPAAINPSKTHGLIEIEVPAGLHQLSLHFQSTAVRDVARTISWISLLVLIPLLLLAYQKQRGVSSDIQAFGQGRILVPVVLALLSVLLIKTTLLDRADNLFRETRFREQTEIKGSQKLNANFGSQLILMGIEAPSSLPADAELDLSLYWRVLNPLDTEYSIGLAIVDKQGNVVGQSDNQHPGGIPTIRWETDEYAQDQHRIRLLPGTPSGEYDVQVYTYSYGQSESRLNIINSSGAPAGQILTAATLNVTAPERPPQVENINMGHQVNLRIGENLVLLGYTVPQLQIRAGDPLFLTLYWQTTAELKEDVKMRIELRDANDKIAFSAVAPLVNDYPTTQWRSGEFLRAEHALPIPPTLAAGDYKLLLDVRSDKLTLGTVTITTPNRVMESPSFSYPAGVRFGDLAELVGYDVRGQVEAGEDLSVELVWKSLGETPVSYKAFVQLLDEGGRLVIGSDVIPANWTRPTTGWIATEYIVDAHTLSIPAEVESGSYQLLVGLYDVVDTERLSTDQGESALLIPQIIEILGE